MSKFSDKYFKAANGETSALRQSNVGKSLFVVGILALPVKGGGWIIAIIIWVIAIFLIITATESTVGDYAEVKHYENFEEWLEDNKKYYDGMYIEDIKVLLEKGEDFNSWLCKQSVDEFYLHSIDSLWRTWTTSHGIVLDRSGKKIMSYSCPITHKIMKPSIYAVQQRLEEEERLKELQIKYEERLRREEERKAENEEREKRREQERIEREEKERKKRDEEKAEREKRIEEAQKNMDVILSYFHRKI